MSFERLAVFALTSTLLIVIPGPSVLFVVGRALAHGRGTALYTVLGNTLGSCVLVVGVALGLGTLLERSALAFAALKFAGAAYLVYLGVRALQRRESVHGALAAGGLPQRRLRTIGQGFVVGVSNPKTIVFFAAILPQFAVRASGHLTLQLLVLGLVFNAIALVSDSVWGLGAATARHWFARSPQRLARIGGVGGLTMIGLGIALAATGRQD